MPSTENQTFVIVGAGAAGAKAAEALREEGFDGRLVLVGSEAARPYARPPLSKGYLRGELDRRRITLHDEGFYAAAGIDLRLARSAERLDLPGRRVVLDDGEALRFDRLLLATGAQPRRLPIPGAGLEGVHVLRDVEDADALRSRLDRGGSVVVLGAGWLGCEFAASARQRGLAVTVVDRAAAPLERVLGPEVGSRFRDLHADHGVRMRLGIGVEAFEGATAVERIRTTDGGLIDCDFAVAAVGVEPRTALAAGAGIAVANGIPVDERLRTSAPGVFAAGDIANAHHRFYGERIRVEHWATARDHGGIAARGMLGRDAAYEALPRFSSSQHGAQVEYVGFAGGRERMVLRDDPAARELVAFWLAGDRVVAGMGLAVPGATDAISRLITERVAVDHRALADPGVPLDALLPVAARPAA